MYKSPSGPSSPILQLLLTKRPLSLISCNTAPVITLTLEIEVLLASKAANLASSVYILLAFTDIAFPANDKAEANTTY